VPETVGTPGANVSNQGTSSRAPLTGRGHALDPHPRDGGLRIHEGTGNTVKDQVLSQDDHRGGYVVER
jgi:hypothetical protein